MTEKERKEKRTQRLYLMVACLCDAVKSLVTAMERHGRNLELIAFEDEQRAKKSIADAIEIWMEIEREKQKQ